MARLGRLVDGGVRPLVGTVALAGALVASACVGDIGGNASPVPPDSGPSCHDCASGTYAPIEARRLTRHELAAVMRDLLGVDVADRLEALPVDAQTPFDNDYTTQAASASLIEGANLVARKLSEDLLEQRAPLEALLPCAPTGPADDTCLKDFIATFGRRALRRPLTTDEVDELATLGDFSVEEDDFLVGVSLVMSAMLQDLSFLYRVEIGEPVPDHPELRRLDGFELASRLSFLLWGTGPDDALLDAAEAGKLDTVDGLRDVATSMLEDPRARAQVARFHALWLDYDRMPIDPNLAASMTKETEALIDRVVFDDGRPWSELFTFSETFVDPELAAHYGFSAVSSPGWVTYPDPGRRQGLLSHGAFLTVGGKFGDTSPVQRGKNIVERLLCRTIPPPPPNVDADDPPPLPPGATCKSERYTMVDEPACASCHTQLDPLGFGLENYGPDGAWRDVEVDDPTCEVTGEGHLLGFGDFNGAAELGTLIADSPEVSACLTQHLYQFAVGRAPTDQEQPLLELVSEGFHERGDFRGLLIDLVASDAFRFLKIEP